MTGYSQSISFSAGPSIYSDHFSFPDPFHFGLQYSSSGKLNGNINLYISRTRAAEGIIGVFDGRDDRTPEIIMFSSFDEFESILNSNPPGLSYYLYY